MIKRSFVLLLAAAALGGGIYALRGKKPHRHQQESPAGPLLLNGPPALLQLPAPSSAASPAQHVPHHFTLTPRIAGLLVIAVTLTVGAYLGLGKGSETARAASAPVGVDAVLSLHSEASIQKAAAAGDVRSEARSIVARAAISQAPPLPAPTQTPTPAPPAPTPAVAAEVEAPPQPTPVVTPVPPPPPADGIEAIICALPWPCQEAIAVASCESGRDMSGRLDGAWATNGNNYGVFQINGIHANRWPDFYESWMDPAKNAQWAYEIYIQQGWYPWDCRWAAYY